MLFCAVLYWAVGFGGYATFRQRTAGDVLRNFGGASAGGVRGAYEYGLKLCYGLAILAAVPLVITPFYNLLMPIIASEPRRRRGSRRGSGSDSGLASSNAATPGTVHGYNPLHAGHGGSQGYHTGGQGYQAGSYASEPSGTLYTDPHIHHQGGDTDTVVAPSFRHHALISGMVLGASTAPTWPMALKCFFLVYQTEAVARRLLQGLIASSCE